MSLYNAIVAVIAGLSVGSFCNVAIYRLPNERSVVRPRSHCPHCGKLIPWYENIPVISYLVLRGRCSGCGAHISIKYPVVELIGGILALLCLYRFGSSVVDTVFAYCFLMALLVITIIDWEHRIIPDQISLPFIFVGIAWSFVNPALSPSSSALGAIAGGGGLLAVGMIYRLIRHSEGMGGGDVKLMAMIGAFLGIKFVLPVIVIASFLGSVYGISIMKRKGKGTRTAVAFGSFLAPAAAFCLLYGPRVLSWYFSRM